MFAFPVAEARVQNRRQRERRLSICKLRRKGDACDSPCNSLHLKFGTVNWQPQRPCSRLILSFLPSSDGGRGWNLINMRWSKGCEKAAVSSSAARTHLQRKLTRLQYTMCAINKRIQIISGLKYSFKPLIRFSFLNPFSCQAYILAFYWKLTRDAKPSNFLYRFISESIRAGGSPVPVC